MSSRSRYRTDDNLDLLKRIADLESRLSKLERTNQLTNSAVNAGSIVVNGGEIVLRKSDVDLDEGFIQMVTGYQADNEVGMALQVRRSNTVASGTQDFDGSDVGASSMLFTTIEGDDPDFKFPTWQLYDKSGAIVIADTFNSRQGLSDPRLHTTWWDPSAYKSSTSGTFAAVAQAYHYHYHPNIRVTVFTQNDAATTSEVRVVDLDSGNVVAGPITGPAASTSGGVLVIDRMLTVNGSGFGNGNTTWLEIQHRRASGAGTVRVLVAEVAGIDLSFT